MNYLNQPYYCLIDYYYDSTPNHIHTFIGLLKNDGSLVVANPLQQGFSLGAVVTKNDCHIVSRKRLPENYFLNEIQDVNSFLTGVDIPLPRLLDLAVEEYTTPIYFTPSNILGNLSESVSKDLLFYLQYNGFNQAIELAKQNVIEILNEYGLDFSKVKKDSLKEIMRIFFIKSPYMTYELIYKRLGGKVEGFKDLKDEIVNYFINSLRDYQDVMGVMTETGEKFEWPTYGDTKEYKTEFLNLLQKLCDNVNIELNTNR